MGRAGSRSRSQNREHVGMRSERWARPGPGGRSVMAELEPSPGGAGGQGLKRLSWGSRRPLQPPGEA